MCDVGYLCAKFSLPMPLCSQLRLDVRDRRQTDVRRVSLLNDNPCLFLGRGGGRTTQEKKQTRIIRNNDTQ